MSRCGDILVSVLTLATIVTPFAAQGDNVIPSVDPKVIPSTLTLTAPGGRYRNLRMDLPCPSGQFATVITLSDPNPSALFAAAARIILRTGNTTKSEESSGAALSLRTYGTDALLIAQVDLWRTGPPGMHPDRTSFFADRPELGTPVPIIVKWSNSAVTFSVGAPDNSNSLTLDYPVKNIDLVGSGGSALFEQNSLRCNS